MVCWILIEFFVSGVRQEAEAEVEVNQALGQEAGTVWIVDVARTCVRDLKAYKKHFPISFEHAFICTGLWYKS